MNILVVIKSGKELTLEELNIINKYRNLRLGRTSIWDHKNNIGFEERTIFMLKENEEIKSFCTIRPIDIFVKEKKYRIWGLQAVVSIDQGKGYGRMLMRSVQEYTYKTGKTLVGFCEEKN